MKSSIYVKRQSFEIRFSVISFVFVAFCQPRILRYSARDVTDIFPISFNLVPRVLSLLRESTLVTAGHVSARF